MLIASLPAAFALGASFACAAAFALRATDNFLVNEYAVYTLVFLSLLYVPCVAYLATAFPSWSLFFLTETIHPLWVALTLAGVVVAGVSGFARVWYRMRGSRNWYDLIAVHDEWILAFVATFAVVGFAHARLLFTGASAAEFAKAATAGTTSVLWFSSAQWYTLLVMCVVLAPGVSYPLLVWPSHNGDHVPHSYSIAVIRRVARTGGSAVLAAALVYVVVALIISRTRPGLSPSSSSLWTPLLGFAISEFVGLFIVTISTILPLSCRKFAHFD